jgi:hypothetical protein
LTVTSASWAHPGEGLNCSFHFNKNLCQVKRIVVLVLILETQSIESVFLYNKFYYHFYCIFHLAQILEDAETVADSCANFPVTLPPRPYSSVSDKMPSLLFWPSHLILSASVRPYLWNESNTCQKGGI